MSKLSKVRRCLVLPPNAAGRDFIVGDLHGHRSLFEKELDRLGFDPRHDRVLSVGDLVDRGPQSLATLSLIGKPWFYAVLGNHELMLLHHLGYYTSRIHGRRSPGGGREWIVDALSRHRKQVDRLADAMAALPLAIHVGGDIPFNVTHGDLQLVGSRQEFLFDGRTVCVHKADAMTSSRDNVRTALTLELMAMQYARNPVRISPMPLGRLPLTYVGHSPLPHVTVHNSYVYIDQGVCLRGSDGVPCTPPTVLEHRKFAHWMHGVAAARGERTTATTSDGAAASRRALACA